MEYWPQVKIGDVCIVERGGSPRPIDKYITDSEDGINWIKIGDTDDSMYITSTAQKIIPEGAKKSRYVQPGDFLLSNSMSFGRPYILKIDGCIHDGWLVLRDKNGLFDKRFLYYYLSAPVTYQKFKSLAVGGVVNNLNSEMVRNVEVPLPALNEQAQIATVLDKLSGLISLRKQQLSKLDELVKARFVEMFGDLADPYCKFKKCTLAETCLDADDIKCGPFGTQLSKDEYQNEGIAVWEIPQINNGFTSKPTHFLTIEKAEQLKAYSIEPGDIAMSRKGNVGKCGVFPDYYEPGIIHSDVLRIRVDSKRVIPCFMMYQLHFSRAVQYQIETVSSGAIMAGINVTKLKQIEVYVPEYELQQRFSGFVGKVDRQKLTIQQSLDKLEVLRKSLMQEYFG
jgi:type I restriction enzyme S subunit